MNTKHTENDTPKESKVDNSRRTFAKKAAGTSLILTLASKPAWGLNCSLSGMMSGNLSEPGGNSNCYGEGCSPGYWKNHQTKWHSAYQPTRYFNTIFGVNAFQASYSYNPASLAQVIHNEAVPILSPNCHRPSRSIRNAQKRLGRHAVAALQNAATRVRFDLTVAEVIDAFVAAFSTGNAYSMNAQADIFDALNNQGCPLS